MSDSTVENICNAVLDMLEDDIISLSELRQVVSQFVHDNESEVSLLRAVSQRLLRSSVEMGSALNSSGDYVEFVGWIGSDEAKINRALSMFEFDALNANFAVWFSLAANVDRYEAMGDGERRKGSL